MIAATNAISDARRNVIQALHELITLTDPDVVGNPEWTDQFTSDIIDATMKLTRMNSDLGKILNTIEV